MYNLVMTENDDNERIPCYNEKGKILVQDYENGSMSYIPISDELLRVYPQLCAQSEVMDVSEVDNAGNSKAYWTYDATILLINKYNAHKAMFADSIHRNVEVWEMISAEFAQDGYSFNGNQCENRWKYIRGRYLKKRDNSGAGGTGEENYKFEYYKEMEMILGKQPNVDPKFVASSESPSRSTSRRSISTSDSSPRTSQQMYTNNSQPHTATPHATFDDYVAEQIRLDSGELLDDDFPDTDSESKSASKGKRRKEPWEENVERQERYHREMMQMQRESIDSFNNFMKKLLEKL